MERCRTFGYWVVRSIGLLAVSIISIAASSNVTQQGCVANGLQKASRVVKFWDFVMKNSVCTNYINHHRTGAQRLIAKTMSIEHVTTTFGQWAVADNFSADGVSKLR